MSDTAIKNSRATLGGGGVINAMGSKIELNSVSVIKAFAAASGGALSLRLCRATIKQSVFRECHSLKSGGAILLSTRSQCTLTKTSFETNQATSSGGGILCNGCAELKTEGTSWFSGNYAGRGGAIALSGGTHGNVATILSSTGFIGNTATLGGGGAIYWASFPPTIENDYDNEANNIGIYGNFIGSGPTFIRLNDTAFKYEVRNTVPISPSVIISDYYNNTVVDFDFGRELLNLRAGAGGAEGAGTSSPSAQSFGSVTQGVDEYGRASFPSFGLAAKPGTHVVIIEAMQDSVQSLKFNVMVQDCKLGQLLSQQKDIFSCVDCTPGLYSSDINPTNCTKCSAGTFEDRVASKLCQPCAANMYSKEGALICGEAPVDKDVALITNMTRISNSSKPNVLELTWLWPTDKLTDKINSYPAVDVALSPDFALEGRGVAGNLTVIIDMKSKVSAIVISSQPIHDLVVYARVRVNTGVSIGEWTALLEPWRVTSDCDHERFLNNLGSKSESPDLFKCDKCPKGADCVGNILFGGVVSKFGWWRVAAKSSAEPDTFTQCLFEASCLGRPNPTFAGKYYNITQSDELISSDEEMTAENDWALKGNQKEECNELWGHSERCNKNTSRCRLCATCLPGFKRQGLARCKVCPESTTNRVLLGFGIAGVIISAVTIVMLSIESAGTAKENSEAIKKIIVNYLQLASLAALFPMRWPAAIESALAIMSAVSSPAQHLLSPDCELSWMQAADAFYKKQWGFAMMPVGVVFACSLFWRMAFYCRDKDRYTPVYYWDRFVLTIVCILFLLYPTIVSQSLAALACEPVGDKFYLAADLEEPCLEGRHLDFVMLVSVPQILCYTLGLPLSATMILFKGRERLEDRGFSFRYGLLYNGYNKSKFWWELTIAIRKVLLVLVAGIYGRRLGPDLQVLVALLLVMIFMASHLVFRPFNEEEKKDAEHGQGHTMLAPEPPMCCRFEICEMFTKTNLHILEFGSLQVCLVTLWSGLVFFLNHQTPRLSADFVVVSSVAIVLLNVMFLILLMVKFVIAFYTETQGRKEVGEWLKKIDLGKHLDSKIKNKSWLKGLKLHKKDIQKKSVKKLSDKKNRTAVMPQNDKHVYAALKLRQNVKDSMSKEKESTEVDLWNLDADDDENDENEEEKCKQQVKQVSSAIRLAAIGKVGKENWKKMSWKEKQDTLTMSRPRSVSDDLDSFLDGDDDDADEFAEKKNNDDQDKDAEIMELKKQLEIATSGEIRNWNIYGESKSPNKTSPVRGSASLRKMPSLSHKTISKAITEQKVTALEAEQAEHRDKFAKNVKQREEKADLRVRARLRERQETKRKISISASADVASKQEEKSDIKDTSKKSEVSPKSTMSYEEFSHEAAKVLRKINVEVQFKSLDKKGEGCIHMKQFKKLVKFVAKKKTSKPLLLKVWSVAANGKKDMKVEDLKTWINGCVAKDTASAADEDDMEDLAHEFGFDESDSD